MCRIAPQTLWIHVWVAVVTAPTTVSPVSVTRPVSASKTVALTTPTFVKVSDKSLF